MEAGNDGQRTEFPAAQYRLHHRRTDSSDIDNGRSRKGNQMSEEKAADSTPPTVSAVPSARTDLPADSPWWAKWIVANVSEAWKMFSVNVPTICAVMIEANELY